MARSYLVVRIWLMHSIYNVDQVFFVASNPKMVEMSSDNEQEEVRKLPDYRCNKTKGLTQVVDFVVEQVGGSRCRA